MSSVPAAPDDFEGRAALFWVAAAAKMPEPLLDLAVASPLAARIPDTGEIWHPGYRSRHLARLVLAWAWESAVGLLRGLAKVIPGVRRFEYRVYGEPGDTLLVLPSALGHEVEHGVFRTPYISSGPRDAVFVLGPRGTCGSGAHPILFSRWEVLGTALSLTFSGLSSFRKAQGSLLERALLMEAWVSWAVSLRWLPSHCMRLALGGLLAEGGFSKLGSVHELNALARTVWRVARGRGMRTYTVQHAEIARTKFWYFPYAEELDAGVALPDVMHVYSPEIADLLRPHYPGVEFRTGCGERYAQWRGARPSAAPAAGRYLFVGAMGRYDNRVVIETLLRLAAEGGPDAPLRLRLHPAAELPRGFARRLRRAVRAGEVELSEGVALRDDIAQAKLVVGMSTTVLEEALILRRPVIQLLDDDYLEYVDLRGVPGALCVDWGDLSRATLAEAAGMDVDPTRLVERLGLCRPVVTYERLFSDAPWSQTCQDS